MFLCRKLESFRFNNFWAVVRDSCDFSIFKSPVFVSFCIHSIVLYLSYDIPYVYIPDMATTAGIDDHLASFLISIIGISSTIGQVRYCEYSVACVAEFSWGRLRVGVKGGSSIITKIFFDNLNYNLGLT